MKKKLTSILIILTLVIFILLFLIKYKSLTGLETKETDPESKNIKKVSNNLKKSNISKKPNKKNISKEPKKIQENDLEDTGLLVSKLKANITKDDVLITGGYKAANGNMRYSCIQAKTDYLNGKKMVMIKMNNFEISPETANDSNLDYLETDNNKIFDHFGILPSEEYRKTLKRLNEKGMVKIISLPGIGLVSGRQGELKMGDDNALNQLGFSIKPTILSDGTFDIELEAKQNRY